MLTDPILFEPVDDVEPRGYRFSGEASVGRMLSGLSGLPLTVASPGGRDTFNVQGSTIERAA
jgi:hypothetical protein